MIEDDYDVSHNQIWNCFGNRLIQKLKGEKRIYLLPNQIIQENDQGILLKFWKSIIGIKKQYNVYVASDAVSDHCYGCSARDMINVGEDGREGWKYLIGPYSDHSYQGLQKTEIQLPPELIDLTMDYLRKEEVEKRKIKEREKRDEEEKEKKESEEKESKLFATKDIREKILSNHKRIQNVEGMLLEIAKHFKINVNNKNASDSNLQSLSFLDEFSGN